MGINTIYKLDVGYNMDFTGSIDRGIEAGIFIHKHKYWTDLDMAEHLRITKAGAVKYRNALMRRYPVKIIREAKCIGQQEKFPALYGLEPHTKT